MSNPKAEAFFQRLGSAVYSRWRQVGCDESAFPTIAEAVLLENPPSETVSFSDAVAFAFSEEPLPYQTDIEATFGQPPLTVYWQHEFRIELLFWTDGLPGIHQHSFSGAFYVMCGSSLHSHWTFECRYQLSCRLLLGQLTLQDAGLLREGDTRRITAGQSFIHATYHMNRPTVTVVIRTNREEHHLPQYLYFRPSIAIAPNQDPGNRRRGQILQMLARSGRIDQLLDISLTFLGNADPVAAFRCLFDAYPLLQSPGDRNRLLQAASNCNPELVEAVRPALGIREHQERIAAMRSRITNPDLRFFLAVLLTLPDRSSIMTVIQECYRGTDPIERIAGWITELSNSGALKIPVQEYWGEVLRIMLQSSSVEKTCHALVERHGSAVESTICDLARTIGSYSLLRPLFETDQSL